MSDMSDVNNERRDSWDGQGEWPAASVIIVTRDRHEAAEAAVRSGLQVDYPAEKLEVENDGDVRAVIVKTVKTA